jgi:hypothetical protein
MITISMCFNVERTKNDQRDRYNEMGMREETCSGGRNARSRSHHKTLERRSLHSSSVMFRAENNLRELSWFAAKMRRQRRKTRPTLIGDFHLFNTAVSTVSPHTLLDQLIARKEDRKDTI